jgi:hypothetical protein
MKFFKASLVFGYYWSSKDRQIIVVFELIGKFLLKMSSTQFNIQYSSKYRQSRHFESFRKLGVINSILVDLVSSSPKTNNVFKNSSNNLQNSSKTLQTVFQNSSKILPTIFRNSSNNLKD